MSFPDPNSVVAAYIDGTRNRDIPLLKSAFTDGAVMTGYLGPDLLHGGPEPFYAALEANEVGADYNAEIKHVTTEGAIATATITEQNLLGLSFVNHFQLVRLPDGGWQISAKLFKHA